MSKNIVFKKEQYSSHRTNDRKHRPGIRELRCKGHLLHGGTPHIPTSCHIHTVSSAWIGCGIRSCLLLCLRTTGSHPQHLLTEGAHALQASFCPSPLPCIALPTQSSVVPFPVNPLATCPQRPLSLVGASDRLCPL